MKPAITSGRCRFRGLCESCQTDPQWRRQAGTPSPCGDSRGPAGPPQPAEQPGTELKQILSSMGISESTGCQCGSMVTKMDRWGCEECGRRMPEILRAMLPSGSFRSKVPFSRTVAGALVRLAIARARKS